MSDHHSNSSSAKLRSQYFDDPEIQEIVVAFVAEMPSRIEQANRAFMRGDLLRLHFWAHQLKGGASGYGFPEISRRAAELECAILEKRSLDEVFQALLSVTELCERASAT
ncbi:MAG: Hpt domain-containing protein [Phycisphaerales bacterium]|nr:Hpt domain-containing protein [Phycisphaerales bacterium]